MRCPNCGFYLKGNDCFACNHQLEVVHKEKKIKVATSDRAAELREYAKESKKFLAKNPRCAVFPNLAANQVHHVRGRRGKWLLDQRYWKAVSEAGHQKIHDYHVWAIENGFKILRSV
jgi:hypothetical protein